MDFITSRKGSDMISHEGFLYRKDKTKLNTINWRCAKTGCKGRLTTSLQYREQQQPPVSSGVHTHPPNPTEVAARRVENSVKTAAVRTRDPPRRIVQDAMTEVNEEVACLCVHTCVERCGGWKVCVERGKRVRVRVSLGFNKGSDVAVVAIAILNESLSCSRSIDSRCFKLIAVVWSLY